MKRKVSQIGPTTLMVSLPSKWVKKYGIKKGDELELAEEGCSLRLITNQDMEIPPIELTIKNETPRYITSVISNLYKKGYDEIKIHFSDISVLGKIQAAISNMIGFEVLSQGSSYCIIKAISRETEKEFDGILRRVFVLIESMINTSLELIKEDKKEDLKEISTLDKTINKLTDLCKRIINKKSPGDEKNKVFLYLIVWNLEKIANEYKFISNYLIEHKDTKISKDTVAFFEEINKLFFSFHDIYKTKDYHKVAEFTENRLKLLDKAYLLLESKKQGEVIVLHHLADLIIMIYNLGGPFIGTLW